MIVSASLASSKVIQVRIDILGDRGRVSTPPITGGSLVLVTVRSKTSLTVLVPSSAVTFTEMVPISALVGVPLEGLGTGIKAQPGR